jgi:hypothetical protein
MRAGETVRFEGGDCRVVFDLTLDPVRDAEIAAELGEVTPDDVEPCCCPICGPARFGPCTIPRSKSPQQDPQPGREQFAAMLSPRKPRRAFSTLGGFCCIPFNAG